MKSIWGQIINESISILNSKPYTAVKLYRQSLRYTIRSVVWNRSL